MGLYIPCCVCVVGELGAAVPGSWSSVEDGGALEVGGALRNRGEVSSICPATVPSDAPRA